MNRRTDPVQMDEMHWCEVTLSSRLVDVCEPTIAAIFTYVFAEIEVWLKGATPDLGSFLESICPYDLKLYPLFQCEISGAGPVMWEGRRCVRLCWQAAILVNHSLP